MSHRDKQKERDRERHKSDVNDRDKDRGKEKVGERNRERERDRDKRDRERDRERDRSDRRERQSDRGRDDRKRDDREKTDRLKEEAGKQEQKLKSEPKNEESSRKRARDDSNDESQSVKKLRASNADGATEATEEDEVKAARRKKLQELSSLLKKQKEQLENQKQEIEKKKKKEEEEKRKRDVEAKRSGAELGIPELRLNTQMQEVDKYGKLAGPVIRHATLLINKRAIDKKIQPLLKQRAEMTANKYFDPNSVGKGRKKKKGFNWVQPGTFVKQAEVMREQESQAKKRKQEDDEDNAMEDENTQRNSEVPDDFKKLIRDERRAFIGKIPIVEWWDKPFLKSSSSYGDDNKDQVNDADFSVWNAPSTILEAIPANPEQIDSNIFHPAPLRPAAEPTSLPPQPLPLTKKEQKRMTKQAREAKRQAETDAIMIGAKEAPPPRVRLANIPRVFSQQAMQDPTAIEVMVRDEMGKRLTRHHERNQERKLSKDERREKKKQKMFEDTSLYSHVAVYKILVPINALNKVKIDANAQQTFLKGCCIMIVPESQTNEQQQQDEKQEGEKSEVLKVQEEKPELPKKQDDAGPKWTLVIVEGGPKSLRRYKKLMLRRIKWNDFSKKEKPKKDMEDEKDDMERDDEGKAQTDQGGPFCYLVWEGEVLQGSFHDFQMKNMKTEMSARKFLQDRGCVHYWDMANTFVPPETPQTI